MIARATVRLAPYDALVMPTTANTPPVIADLADDKAFTKAEPAVAAQLHADQHDRRLRDLAACHREGEVPVGLMLAASGGVGSPHF